MTTLTSLSWARYVEMRAFFPSAAFRNVSLIFYGPFTLAIFAAISSAILRRFQIDRVNYWRFRSDTKYTGDFKSQIKSKLPV